MLYAFLFLLGSLTGRGGVVAVGRLALFAVESHTIAAAAVTGAAGVGAGAGMGIETLDFFHNFNLH